MVIESLKIGTLTHRLPGFRIKIYWIILSRKARISKQSEFSDVRMKADCGLITPTIFHRVKIKDESKECGYQQALVSTSTSSVSTSTTAIFTNSMSTSNTLPATASNSDATVTVASNNQLAVSASVTPLINTVVGTTSSTTLNTYSSARPNTACLIFPSVITTSRTLQQGLPIPDAPVVTCTIADSADVTKIVRPQILADDTDLNHDREPVPEGESDRETETETDVEAEVAAEDAAETQTQTDHRHSEAERGLKPNAKGNQSDSASSLNQAKELQDWSSIEKGTSTQRKDNSIPQSEYKGHTVRLSVSPYDDSIEATHAVKPEHGSDDTVVNGLRIDQQFDTVVPLRNSTSTLGGNDESNGVVNNAITESDPSKDNINRGSSKSISGILGAHTKLRRLLSTLVQFASDISSDTGDTVRTLILALLSGSMTAEEFHSSLQEATNFPLRGFVLHYLKHTLPTLHKDLTAAARATNQNCAQFLRSNENMVLEAIGLMSTTEPIEIFGEYVGVTGVANCNANGNGNGNGNGNSNSNGNGNGNGNGSSSSSSGSSTSSGSGTGNGVAIGGNCATGAGNPRSPHYGSRPNTNSGTSGIQQTNNSTTTLRQYSKSPHLPKRRASDTLHCENGSVAEDTSIYGKRHMSSWFHQHAQQAQSSSEGSPAYGWYHPFHSSGGTIQGLAQGRGSSSQVHGHAPTYGLAHGHGHSHGHGNGHGHGHSQNQMQASTHGLAHTHGHAANPMPPSLVQINQINTFSGSQHFSHQQQSAPIQTQAGASGSLDDEWKNIHVMLNCILGMVEKTKRALAILQRRGCSSPVVSAATITSLSTSNNHAASTAQIGTNVIAHQGNGCSSSAGADTQVESSTNDREGNLKRLSGEIVAQTLRATEDRVAEVKRKAENLAVEEAVLEVKRAAVAEMQRAIAVAIAESRANERLRTHRLLDPPLPQRGHAAFRQGPFLRLHGSAAAVALDAAIRSSATTATTSNAIASSCADEEKEMNSQSISGSSCWNCGRQALETCGGCGIARYCGFFCQHRDWEAGHHATCNNSSITRDSRRSTSQSPPRTPCILSSSTDDLEAVQTGGTAAVTVSSAGTAIKGK